MISPIVIAAFALFIVSTHAQTTVLIGVTSQGRKCKAPLECKSPLYCVPRDSKILSTEYTCEKMPCGPLAPCSIGLQCGSDGFCEGLPCTKDSECLGITICSASENRCKPKVSSGNRCERDAECWSDKCDDNICLSATSDGEVVIPYRRNRAADISLGVLGLLSLITLLLLSLVCLKRSRSKKASSRDADDADTEDPIVRKPSTGRPGRVDYNNRKSNDKLTDGPVQPVKNAAARPVGAVQQVGDAVRNGTTAAVDTAKNGASAAGDAVRHGATVAADTGKKAANAAVDTGKKAANAVGGAANAAVDTGKKAATAVGDTGKKAADSVRNNTPEPVKNAVVKAGETVHAGASRVAEGASDAADAAKNAASNAFDAAKNAVKR